MGSSVNTILERDLRQVICELELVSHAGTANYDFAAPPEGSSVPAGKWAQGRVKRQRSTGSRDKGPPGGIGYTDDKEPEFSQKSADHFRRRIARAYGEDALVEILSDAEKALVAWRRQPAPTKANEPAYGTPQWKRYVAESSESHGEIARRFNVTRAYIQQVRRLYAESL